MTKWRAKEQKKSALNRAWQSNGEKLANLYAHEHSATSFYRVLGVKISTPNRFVLDPNSPRAPEGNFKLEIPDEGETKLEIET